MTLFEELEWRGLIKDVAGEDIKDKLDNIAAGAEVNVQADWTQTTTTADDYIKNKPNLAAVATSGSYSDLSNKPRKASFLYVKGLKEGTTTLTMLTPSGDVIASTTVYVS